MLSVGSAGEEGVFLPTGGMEGAWGGASFLGESHLPLPLPNKCCNPSKPILGPLNYSLGDFFPANNSFRLLPGGRCRKYGYSQTSLCSGRGYPTAYCTPSDSWQVQSKTQSLTPRPAHLSPEHRTLGGYRPEVGRGPRRLASTPSPPLPPTPHHCRALLGSADESVPRQPSVHTLVSISTNLFLAHESVHICALLLFSALPLQ